MKYLRKIWVRAIISMLFGALTTEIIHIATGDPNRPMGTNFTLIYALIVFLILTFLLRKMDKDSSS